MKCYRLYLCHKYGCTALGRNHIVQAVRWAMRGVAIDEFIVHDACESWNGEGGQPMTVVEILGPRANGLKAKAAAKALAKWLKHAEVLLTEHDIVRIERVSNDDER